MSSESRPAAEDRPVPAFTPVPLRSRRDGWTPERQEAFLRHLADSLCVEHAARAVGMSRETAYRLRRKPGAESFAAAWDSIFAAQPRGASDPALLWHRAFYGVMKPIVRQGVTVGMLHTTDDDALITLMRRFDRLTRPSERHAHRRAQRSR